VGKAKLLLLTRKSYLLKQKNKLIIWILCLTAVSNSAQLLDFVWTGAVDDNSAVVAAAVKDHRTTNGTFAVEVKAFTNANLTGAEASSWSGNAVSSSCYIVKAHLTGLSANTKYYFGVYVDSVLDDTLNDADNDTNAYTGTFRTFPPAGEPATFQFVFSCSGKPGTERNAIWETMADVDALFFLHTGDLYYSDQGSNPKGYASKDDFRNKFDLKLNCYPGKNGAREASYHRKVPIAYMWDDHDFGKNNSVGTSGPGAISKNYVHPVYREYFPHYPLIGSGTTNICQKFSVGRVLFLMTDLRTDAQTPGTTFDKTRMGAEQKEWFKKELLEANGVYSAIIWVNTVPWTGAPVTGEDRWQSYTNERAEISNFIKDNNIQGFCALAGDTHCTAIDDGTNTDFSEGGGAAFPIFHAGPLGSHNSVKGGPYSKGSTAVSDRNFGVVAVTDNSDYVEITWTGKNLDGSTATNESSGAGYPAIGAQIQYSFVFSNPVVTTFFPEKDSVDLPLNTNLSLDFNKNISTNSGSIIIRKRADNSVHSIIPINSVNVSFGLKNLTVDIPTDLESSTEYYVTVETTAIADTNGNYFAGISAHEGLDYYKWNFTTATPEPALTFSALLLCFFRKII